MYVVVDTDKKDHEPKIIWYVYMDKIIDQNNKYNFKLNKKFPYLPYGIFWGMKPPTRIFLRLA